MSKIKIDDIRSEAESKSWKLLSDEYKNLDSELLFECPNKHKVTVSFKKWRINPRCPICEKAEAISKLSEKVPRKAAGTRRILALDDATGTTGFSVFDNDKLIHYGKVTMNETDPIQRIASVRQWMTSLVENWRPDIVALEDIQLQQGKFENVKTFKVLAQLQGTLLVSLYESGIEYIVVPPATWRSTCHITSRTRNDQKREAQKKVEEWYDIKATQDEADAICIGYHVTKKYLKNDYMIDWGDPI